MGHSTHKRTGLSVSGAKYYATFSGGGATMHLRDGRTYFTDLRIAQKICAL